MRIVGAIILGFALLVGLSVGVDRYIVNSSQELVNLLEKVDMAIHNEQWDQAAKQLAQMEDRWKTTQKWWSIFLHHREIENIDESLSRLKQYVEHQGLVMSVAELSTLKKFVDHIADSETFSFTNIL